MKRITLKLNVKEIMESSDDDNGNKRIKLDNTPNIIRHQLNIVPNTKPKSLAMAVKSLEPKCESEKTKAATVAPSFTSTIEPEMSKTATVAPSFASITEPEKSKTLAMVAPNPPPKLESEKSKSLATVAPSFASITEPEKSKTLAMVAQNPTPKLESEKSKSLATVVQNLTVKTEQEKSKSLAMVLQSLSVKSGVEKSKSKARMRKAVVVKNIKPESEKPKTLAMVVQNLKSKSEPEKPGTSAITEPSLASVHLPEKPGTSAITEPSLASISLPEKPGTSAITEPSLASISLPEKPGTSAITEPSLASVHLPEKSAKLPMESNDYISADDILVKDEETVIDDSESPPCEPSILWTCDKPKSDYQMLLDILKRHTFAGVQDVKEPGISIEEVSTQEASLEVNKKETKLADPKLQVVEYLEKSIIQIERLKEKAKRKDIYEKLKERLENKKMSFISFIHRESASMKAQFKFYMRICLDEDAIEKPDSVILIGTVLDNDLPIDYFNSIWDCGKNSRLLPSSRIILIYRICPILPEFLFQNTVIRIYDDYTVNRFVDIKPRSTIIDYEYYILDGYNICLETEVDNDKTN